MSAVDAIGRASRASPASKGTLPFIPTTATLLLWGFSPGSAGFVPLHVYLQGQHVIQSPGGRAVCKTSLCTNEINYQAQLSLQNKILAATATNIISLKNVRILSSIPGSFFSQGPVGPRPRSDWGNAIKGNQV